MGGMSRLCPRAHFEIVSRRVILHAIRTARLKFPDEPCGRANLLMSRLYPRAYSEIVSRWFNAMTEKRPTREISPLIQEGLSLFTDDLYSLLQSDADIHEEDIRRLFEGRDQLDGVRLVPRIAPLPQDTPAEIVLIEDYRDSRHPLPLQVEVHLRPCIETGEKALHPLYQSRLPEMW